MTAEYAFQFLQFVARKHQFGQITPLNYTQAVSSAQNSLYDWLIGLLEQNQYGKPVPRVAVGQGLKVEGFLSPLKISDVSITVTTQQATKPDDYNYLALMVDSTGRRVERIDDTKLPARLNSKIDPVTDTSTPFYVNASTYWKIYPSTVTPVIINYYKRPPNTVWGYTLDSDGRPVYNPATSVDPVFDDVAMVKVLGRAMRILGFSFTEGDWIEYGKEVKEGGE